MGKKSKQPDASEADPFADFDLDGDLPKAIDKAALGSGGYPYDEKLKRKNK